MEYSGAGGKLIHEKNQKQKISWHCPFNPHHSLPAPPSLYHHPLSFPPLPSPPPIISWNQQPSLPVPSSLPRHPHSFPVTYLLYLSPCSLFPPPQPSIISSFTLPPSILSFNPTTLSPCYPFPILFTINHYYLLPFPTLDDHSTNQCSFPHECFIFLNGIRWNFQSNFKDKVCLPTCYNYFMIKDQAMTTFFMSNGPRDHEAQKFRSI